jgi:hypothetical protein
MNIMGVNKIKLQEFLGRNYSTYFPPNALNYSVGWIHSYTVRKLYIFWHTILNKAD